MDRNSATDSFSPGYCEYLVEGFASKRIIALRIAAVVIGLVLSAFVCMLLMSIPQVFFIWLVVIFAFELILFRLTKREFEYTAAMGELTVEIIYGKKWRRKLFVVRIADADRIFSVDSFNDTKIKNLGVNKVIFASPKKSGFMYCLVTKADVGKNSGIALVFSSCKKLNDALKFYNRSAFTEIK